jgi:hypothetical protein
METAGQERQLAGLTAALAERQQEGARRLQQRRVGAILRRCVVAWQDVALPRLGVAARRREKLDAETGVEQQYEAELTERHEEYEEAMAGVDAPPARPN